MALREEIAAAAAAATAAAAELNLLTSATDGANGLEHPTPSKSHSVSGSRHSASAPVTNAPTRDGSPMLITPNNGVEGNNSSMLLSQDSYTGYSRLSNTRLDTHDTTSTSSGGNISHTSASNANHRRHTEASAVLNEELESYIRTSRSNVEDVVHPGEHINISPVDPHSSAASNAMRKPSAESMSETESNNNADTKKSASVISSPTKERPKLAPVDESFSSKTTSVRMDPTAIVNIVEETVQESTVQGTATDSTLSSGLATEFTNSDSAEVNNTSEDNANSCEHTPLGEDKKGENDTLPITSRPTTPYGGRKGQELLKAIENDQVYSGLSEQDIAVEPCVDGDAKSNGIVQNEKVETTPNTHTHSFEVESSSADAIILETAV